MLHNSTTKAEFLKILATVACLASYDYMQSGYLCCDFYKLVELRGQWEPQSVFIDILRESAFSG